MVSPSGASSGIARPGGSTAPCTGGRPALPVGGESAPQLRIDPQATEERIVRSRGRKLFFGGNAGIDHDQALRGGWRQVAEHALHCFLATSAETRATHQTDAHATNHHDTRHDRDDIGAPALRGDSSLSLLRLNA